MRGCYVYFVNDDTRRFFESRIQRGKPEIIPFQNSLSLLNLRAVANASYESLDALFAEESVSDDVRFLSHFAKGGFSR